MIKIDILENIGLVTLNNDKKLNVINEELIRQLKIAKVTFETHKNIDVILLKANKGVKVWSAGHDINELPKPGNDPLHRKDALPKLVRAIESFHAPVIAVIEGSVWGGACEMVMACDLIIAEKNSTFAITPSKLGVPYSVSGLINFIKTVPKHILNEMLFTAEPIKAESLHQYGVINKIVEKESLEEEALNYARKISTRSSLSIRSMKETLRVLSTVISIPTSEIERLEDLRREAYSSEDYEEGLLAVKNKRDPNFKK